jgi:hypothetical protein
MRSEKLIRGPSGLAVFVAENSEKVSRINLSRSFERFALKATPRGIKHTHMNVPCEEVEVRTKLQRHLGLGTEQPSLPLRIGYADPLPRSYRRTVEDVLLEAEG